MATSHISRLASIGLVLVVLGLVVSGCGGGGGGQEEKEHGPETAVGQFVGEAPDADAFVALIAEEPQEGQESTREVRAYLCDGEEINEWFTGTVEGNELNLSSEEGSRLTANLSPESVSGTITLADGQNVSFRASPARGIAGLYDVTIANSMLSGASEAGGRLEAQIGTEPENDVYPVSGTITPPEGEPQATLEGVVSVDASGECRFIVLADGRIKGGFKKGQGAGFMETGSDF